MMTKKNVGKKRNLRWQKDIFHVYWVMGPVLESIKLWLLFSEVAL